MSKSIAMRKVNGRLDPVDYWAAEALDDLPDNKVLNATVTVARGMDADDEHRGALNFYHAGIGVLFDNIDGAGPGARWPTATHLRKFILAELGFYTAIPQRDGGIRKDVDSMAMNRMTLEDLRTCTELSQAKALEFWGWDPWEEWKRQHPLPTPKPGAPQ